MNNFFKVLARCSIHAYRWSLKPLTVFAGFLGVSLQCKYPVSCSEYAMEQIETEKKFGRAFLNIFARLLSCGPWHSKLERL